MMIETDIRQFRDVCGQFGTGVTVITTHSDGHDHGMTANAFMSISLDPPLVAISISDRAKILPKIERTGRFAVSILASGMDDLAWHFAGKPKPGIRDCFERRDDLPLIKGAIATFVTDVASQTVAGDHTIFVGQVRSFSHNPGLKPLLFFRGQFGALTDTHPAPASFQDIDYQAIW